MFKSFVGTQARSVLLIIVLVSGPVTVSSLAAASRGNPRFPDVYVKAGQQFYITASHINKADVKYYGYGGVSFFSADPGYVFGADGIEYLFDVEPDGTILPADSSTYTRSEERRVGKEC